MGLSSEASLRFTRVPACDVHELHQHYWLGAVIEITIENTQGTKFHSRAGLDVGRADEIVVAEMIVHEALLVTPVHVMGRLSVPPSPATRGCVAQNGPHPTPVSLRCGTMRKWVAWRSSLQHSRQFSRRSSYGWDKPSFR